MKDESGREINYLRLSVTDLCNFRCTYCMGEEGIPKRTHDEMLSVEEAVEITAAAAACGISKVRITGGEPLVRRGVMDIIRGICALPGISEVCLTTNGALLSQFAQELRTAGVSRLNISLDTLDPDKFRRLTRGGELSVTLAGIEAARRAGFERIKLNTVLIGGVNDDEIPALAALTRDAPIDVRFIELMPIGECAAWDKSRFISANRVLESCPELEPAGSDGVALSYRAKGSLGTVGLIPPMSRRFCSTCNRIRVTADGKLKPCLHSPLELPLRGMHGEALAETIKRGIAQKPTGHELEKGKSGAGRRMCDIGG